MLHLYKSRDLTSLVTHYLEIDPKLPTQLFAKQPVIVPNKMIGRWLQQQLAKADGISVNLEPVLPANYSWRLMRQAVKDLPENSDFSAEVMLFNVLKALSDSAFTHDFPRLDNYLDVCTDADRTVLASKISRIFDHYQVYRGYWLSAWEQGDMLGLGKDEPWQQAMWQLLTKHSDEKYRSQLEQQLIQAIETQSFELPQSLCIFGVANLPASFINIVKALSQHCDCYVFAFSANENNDVPVQIKHWHQTGNEFFAQLDIQAIKPLIQSENQSQLQSLKSRLTGNDTPVIEEDDQSLIVVNCFSEMREVEALYDYLLNQFASDPNLNPDEVVVAIADLDKYAPFIKAVFNDSFSETSATTIPYVINGSLTASESPLINGLLELLQVPKWRFTREQVMVLARNRLIQRKFNFTDDALDQVDDWLDEAGVRWGIDAEHKQSLGLPASQENTWRLGLDRLLLGFVLPRRCNSDLPLFNGLLPVDDIEGELSGLLSRFVDYCELLFYWKDKLSVDYAMEEWQLLIQQLVDDFFAIDELEDHNHLQLMELLNQFKQQSVQARFNNQFSVQALTVLFNEQLSSTSRSGRLAGVVNFTSMNNLAGIPFKKICLLGMNYDAWPSQQREPGFDLLQSQRASNPRQGDRNKANEERYLTLQLILAAQQSLYVSYVGRNIHNGGEIPPSVLVSELLDCCAQASIKIHVHQHSMHCYSADNFRTGSDLHSHSDQWLEVAKEVGLGKKEITPLFSKTFKTPEPISQIEFDDFCGFFRNPQNSFLRTSLGVYIRDETNDWENAEPFNLSNFADSRIRAIALNQSLVGKPDTSGAMAQASGKLPHGIYGDILQGIEQESVAALLDDIGPEFLQEPLVPIAVDIQIEGINITGVLRDICPQGQLLLISDKLYPWQTIQLWLRHLLLCCIRPDGVECVTKVNSLSGELVLKDVESPQERLGEWLKAYCTGLVRPLPLFPKVSFAYAELYDAEAEENWDAQNEANKLWEPSFISSGESSKPANEYLYRGNSPLNDEFQSLAEQLIVPIIEAGSSDYE